MPHIDYRYGYRLYTMKGYASLSRRRRQAKLSKDAVAGLIAEYGLGGEYFNTKIPYGYNYADKNQEVVINTYPDVLMTRIMYLCTACTSRYRGG